NPRPEPSTHSRLVLLFPAYSSPNFFPAILSCPPDSWCQSRKRPPLPTPPARTQIVSRLHPLIPHFPLDPDSRGPSPPQDHLLSSRRNPPIHNVSRREYIPCRVLLRKSGHRSLHSRYSVYCKSLLA